MSRLFDKLADGLKKAADNTGFSKAVLGLSGGVDSAVAAAIACKALGADSVNLFYLPYNDIDPHGFSDAKAVADFFGASLIYMDITRIADPYFDSIINPTDRRRTNVLSRLRMLVLYDQSALYNALVVGSANKSEIMLGSITLYGDTACAVNPLGNIYKTEVWELAKEIGFPDIILLKAQNTGLYNGATDDGEPFLYTEADKLLLILETNGYSAEVAVKEGFQKEFAERVIKLIENSEFKRRASITLER
ncbi:MAG: NAD(+) synthase [Deferribacteraceae bacterium]|jgi:NAD+ synthase|nr:NAD(+) synthase [Deferribacteraceae bacterium]